MTEDSEYRGYLQQDIEEAEAPIAIG